MTQTDLECFFFETMYTFRISVIVICLVFDICDLEFPEPARSCLSWQAGLHSIQLELWNGQEWISWIKS
jgi:hypothetical protein